VCARARARARVCVGVCVSDPQLIALMVPKCGA